MHVLPYRVCCVRVRVACVLQVNGAGLYKGAGRRVDLAKEAEKTARLLDSREAADSKLDIKVKVLLLGVSGKRQTHTHTNTHEHTRKHTRSTGMHTHSWTHNKLRPCLAQPEYMLGVSGVRTRTHAHSGSSQLAGDPLCACVSTGFLGRSLRRIAPSLYVCVYICVYRHG